jgi:hypothetical protein
VKVPHRKSYRVTNRDIRFFRKIGLSVAESLVVNGDIDPLAPTDAEFNAQVALALRKWERRKKRTAVIDFRGGILAEARKHKKANHPEFAVVFYAMWFEHWINTLLHNRAHLLKLTVEQFETLLFQNLEAKYLCFPAMLGFRSISHKTLRTILAVARARNQFMHYKIREFPMNDAPPLALRCKGVLTSVEVTVRYLLRYEDRYVYQRVRQRLRRLFAIDRDGKHARRILQANIENARRRRH